MREMEKEEFDAVILCNGEFPTHPKALEVLHNAKYLCCCDGAAEECLAHGICPDAIVGDGDSLPKALKERYADIVHIVKEQEFNDMTKATRFCKNRGPRIAYLGATGKREDHTETSSCCRSIWRRSTLSPSCLRTTASSFLPKAHAPSLLMQSSR